MKIKQLMTDHVEGISPTETVLQAANLMSKHNFGFLPVIDSDAQVIGALTDRDLVIRILATSAPLDTKVEAIMTKPVYTIEESEAVSLALSLMAEKQIRRLPVVNKQNQLVGIISLGDLATYELTDERAGMALKEISEPTTNPNRDLEVDDFPL